MQQHCAYVGRDGRQCPAIARTASGYCPVHGQIDPYENAARNARIRVLGAVEHLEKALSDGNALHFMRSTYGPTWEEDAQSALVLAQLSVERMSKALGIHKE